jgi:hypothetical protein
MTKVTPGAVPTGFTVLIAKCFQQFASGIRWKESKLLLFLVWVKLVSSQGTTKVHGFLRLSRLSISRL